MEAKSNPKTRMNLKTRSEAGKGFARRLRRAGRVPGVIYGGGGDTVLVSMEAREAMHLLQSISRNDTVLDLAVDGGASERAVVRDVQAHPFRPELLHVDFLRVRTSESGGDNG